MHNSPNFDPAAPELVAGASVPGARVDSASEQARVLTASMSDRLVAFDPLRNQIVPLLKYYLGETHFLPTLTALREAVKKNSGFLGVFRAEDPIWFGVDDSLESVARQGSDALIDVLQVLGEEIWHVPLDSALGFFLHGNKGACSKGEKVAAAPGSRRERYFGMVEVTLESVPVMGPSAAARAMQGFHEGGIQRFEGFLASFRAGVEQELALLCPILTDPEASRRTIRSAELRKFLEAGGRAHASGSPAISKAGAREISLEKIDRATELWCRHLKFTADQAIRSGFDCVLQVEAGEEPVMRPRVSPMTVGIGPRELPLAWVLNASAVLSLAHKLAMPGPVLSQLMGARSIWKSNSNQQPA